MLRRFGASMRRSWRMLAVVTVVAGLLALLLVHADVRGRVGIAYWKSQAQACGSLLVVNGHVSSGDPQAATDCFMQAYTHCRAATLVKRVFDIDEPQRYTYLIEPQLFAGGAHSCSIQGNWTPVGISAKQDDPYDWTECAGVDQRSDGLHISGCGQGNDFVVPST